MYVPSHPAGVSVLLLNLDGGARGRSEAGDCPVSLRLLVTVPAFRKFSEEAHRLQSRNASHIKNDVQCDGEGEHELAVWARRYPFLRNCRFARVLSLVNGDNQHDYYTDYGTRLPRATYCLQCSRCSRGILASG